MTIFCEIAEKMSEKEEGDRLGTIERQQEIPKIGRNITNISMHIWIWAGLMFSRFAQ